MKHDTTAAKELGIGLSTGMAAPGRLAAAGRMGRGRRRRGRRDQRGIALILVLGAITVLTVMLTEFQDDTSADLSTALAERDALKAEYLAKSGIELSRLVLASEETIRKAILATPMGLLMGNFPQIPVWEYSDMILGAFNDKEKTEAFLRLTGTDPSQAKNLGIEGGHFEVKIIDEDAKLNVNVASRLNAIDSGRLTAQLLSLMVGDRYAPMFDQRDADGQFSDRPTVCSAIIDWADADENLWVCDLRMGPSAGGTEDNYYQLLKKPYWRKNAAYDSLDELHLVRGVSDDFWATFVDPDPTNPSKRVMTVWGQGAVNINSANPQTLLALICTNVDQTNPPKICVDPAQSMMFLTKAAMFKAMLPFPLFASPGAFVNALGATTQTQQQGGAAATTPNPFDIAGMLTKMLFDEPIKLRSADELKKSISTKSEVFSIYADGIVPGYQRHTRVRIHAVVDRRGAPAPGTTPWTAEYLRMMQGGQSNPSPGSTATTGTGTSGTGGSLNNQWSTAPSPGGTIIYYREE